MLLWTVIESPWSHHDSAETRSSTSNPQFRLRPREVPSCLLARQTTAPFSAAIAAASSIKNASNFVQNCSAFDLSSPSTFPFYGAPFLFSPVSLSLSLSFWRRKRRWRMIQDLEFQGWKIDKTVRGHSGLIYFVSLAFSNFSSRG